MPDPQGRQVMSDATKIPQDLCPACKQPVNVPSGGWHEGRFYTEGVKHPMYSTGKPEISDERLVPHPRLRFSCT
jgi:hypothetical protein